MQKIFSFIFGSDQYLPFRGFFTSALLYADFLNSVHTLHHCWYDFYTAAGFDDFLISRDLVKLLAGATAGLHSMIDEHFGISVVEFMAAGAIPIGVYFLRSSKLTTEVSSLA